jgi:hypothetical protein
MTDRDKLAAGPADPPETDLLGPDVPVAAARPTPPAPVGESVPCRDYQNHASSHRFKAGAWTCDLCRERP